MELRRPFSTRRIIIAGSILTISFAALLVAMTGKEVTVSDVKYVKNGMTVPEVLAVIGPRPGIAEWLGMGYYRFGCDWDLIDGRISVVFDDLGRVCETSTSKDAFSVVMNRRFDRFMNRLTGH